MGKTIFITEKPSVAQEYRKVLKVSSSKKTDGYIEGNSPVLGKEVIITWAVGHLVAICAPEKQNDAWSGGWKKENLPMIPEKFKYAPLSNTHSQYKIVKSLYTRSDIDCIYYAGDSGREGIYIQALIRNQIFKTAPKIDERVVWIDSFTEEAILNGIRDAKPYSSYQPMIDSGYMRAISDWLIGMNFTEAFSLTSGVTINVGRVMTPTLAMVVKRQEEIDHFTKTPYFGIKADSFANWRAAKGSRFFESDVLYNENGFLKREHAQALVDEFNSDKTLKVVDVKVQTKTEYAPYLFNLADLQAKCSKAFHITPAQTLEIAQALYEKKFTTYPRTDCRFLSTAVADDLKKKKGFEIPKRYVDDSKITDHYALIPTFQGDVSSLSDFEKKVYNVILKRFNDILMPPYIYDAVSVTYAHSNGEKLYEAFRLVKQLGFKAQAEEEETKSDETDESETVANKPIPEKGAVVTVHAFTIKEMETKPPVAYTTGSLILAMEKAGKLVEDEELRETIKTSGIGTSATRANIIDKLTKKGFITVDKKQKIAPTEFGKKIIPLIAKYDEALTSPLKTADMEDRLNSIVHSEQTKDEYLSFVMNYVAETTRSILANNKDSLSSVSGRGVGGKSSAAQYNCPCCGQIMKYGKYGWYCPSETCKFKLGAEICGYKTKEKDIADLCSKGKTAVHTFRSPKNNKEFRASLVVDKANQGTKFEFSNDWN